MKLRFWTVAASFLDSLIAAVGSWYVVSKLQSGTSMDKWMLITLAVFFCAAIFAIVSIVLESLSDKCSFLRKVLDPSNFIEGDWIQIIDDPSLTQMPPTELSLLRISVKEGRYTVHGHSYNQNDGKEITSFFSQISEYNKEQHYIEYLYRFHTEEFRDDIPHFGNAKLSFTRDVNNIIPNKYIGTITSNLPRANSIKVKAIKCNRIKLQSGKRVKINRLAMKNPEIRQQIRSIIKKSF